jgi:predicted dehydrogenase
MMQRPKIVFGIAGSGWRAECFLQVAQLLPELFEVCGVVTRSQTRKAELETKWAAPVYPSVAALLAAAQPRFVVTAVAREVAARFILELTGQGVPVLAETPPAGDLRELTELYGALRPDAKVQVAEQYHLQPMHQARLTLAGSGRLGEIHYAHVSINHSYHGISLIRRALGIGFENAVINAFGFEHPAVEGPGRNGPPDRERIVRNDHLLAVIDFGAKSGLFDFEQNQHRSWARSERMLIRGVRGEIHNDSVKYLRDFRTPVTFELKRQSAGEYENVEGYYLKGILGGEAWLYTNPFLPGRLMDEEIALATCLMKMDQYVSDGTEFYSLAEASQDQYLALMMEESRQLRHPVETATQIWAPAR